MMNKSPKMEVAKGLVFLRFYYEGVPELVYLMGRCNRQRSQMLQRKEPKELKTKLLSFFQRVPISR